MLMKEVTPATQTPIPLRELGAHLRLGHGFTDDGSEDALLELYLRNATAIVEARTSKALISRVFILQIANWNRRGHLHLPIGPVTVLDRIELIRPGSTITLDPAEWTLHPGSGRQRVTGPNGGTLRTMPHGALAEIEFTAGFGETWNDVPNDLRQAVLLLASHLYEHRDGELTLDGGLPNGVAPILARHQPVRL